MYAAAAGDVKGGPSVKVAEKFIHEGKGGKLPKRAKKKHENEERRKTMMERD